MVDVTSLTNHLLRVDPSSKVVLGAPKLYPRKVEYETRTPKAAMLEMLFLAVLPEGWTSGIFRREVSSFMSSRGEGGGKSALKRKRCVWSLPKQKWWQKSQPFSPFQNSPTRFLMCPPTRLQLANRLETAETFSSGKDIFRRVEGECVAPALVVFGVVWLGGYEASILGYPSRSRYKFGAT